MRKNVGIVMTLATAARATEPLINIADRHPRHAAPRLIIDSILVNDGAGKPG